MKPNLNAIDEYYKKESEYLARVAELDEITAQRDSARAEYDVTCRYVDVYLHCCVLTHHTTAPSQAAIGHFHGRIQYHHTEAQGNVPRMSECMHFVVELGSVRLFVATNIR